MSQNKPAGSLTLTAVCLGLGLKTKFVKLFYNIIVTKYQCCGNYCAKLHIAAANNVKLSEGFARVCSVNCIIYKNLNDIVWQPTVCICIQRYVKRRLAAVRQQLFSWLGKNVNYNISLCSSD